MKLEKYQINFIQNCFAELQTKEDLVALIGGAKDILYGENCGVVSLKSLTYYANPALVKSGTLLSK